MLEYWNLTFSSALILFNLFLSWVFYHVGGAIYNFISITSLLQLTFYFYAMTKRAPGAIRYIDPNWDNASPDGHLYPFYWYWFEDNRGNMTQEDGT